MANLIPIVNGGSDNKCDYMPEGIHAGKFIASVHQTILADASNIETPTSGEQAITTDTIPGDLLTKDGDMLVLEYRGSTANNANTKSLILKWGGITLYNSANLPTNRQRWRLTSEMFRRSATVVECYTYVEGFSAEPANGWYTEVDITSVTSQPGTISGFNTSNEYDAVFYFNGAAFADLVLTRRYFVYQPAPIVSI